MRADSTVGSADPTTERTPTMPTPLEIDTSLLAEFYRLTPAEVMGVAMRNLTVMAAYQAGRSSESPESLVRLLLAPQVSPETAPRETAPRETAPRETAPRVNGGSAEKEILEAASKMTMPFRSSDLASDRHSPRKIGVILSGCRWPSRSIPGTAVKTWLPRSREEGVTVDRGVTQ